MTARLKGLGHYLRGWAGYFALVPLKSFFAELDKWVRRRLRACYWKQGRKPRARIRNLLTLGLTKDEAVPFGSCSRGAWFMAHCRSMQSTLSNDHHAQHGLVSLLTIWSKLALKFRNALCLLDYCADPHARCCGRGPVKAGPYPDRFVRRLPQCGIRNHQTGTVTIIAASINRVHRGTPSRDQFISVCPVSERPMLNDVTIASEVNKKSALQAW